MIAKMPDHDLWMVFFRDSEGNLMGLMSEVRTRFPASGVRLPEAERGVSWNRNDRPLSAGLGLR